MATGGAGLVAAVDGSEQIAPPPFAANATAGPLETLRALFAARAASKASVATIRSKLAFLRRAAKGPGPLLRSEFSDEAARLKAAEAALAKDARNVTLNRGLRAPARAESKVVVAHNAVQPIVALPDALQRKIIDLLPVGR